LRLSSRQRTTLIKLIQILSNHNRNLNKQENRDLKKTVYELSQRLSYKGGSAGLFNIEKVMGSQLSTQPSDVPDPRHADISAATLQLAKGKRAEKDGQLLGLGVGADKERVDDDRVFFFKYVMKGHNGAVYHVNYSPCGTMLASSSFDRTVKIWHMDDSAREHEAQSLDGHTMLVPEVAWSDDSKMLVSGSFDKHVKLWDIARGESVFSADTNGFVQTVSFEPQTSNNVFYAGNLVSQA